MAKKKKFSLKGYNDHGLRMLDVLVYALELGDDDKQTTAEILAQETGGWHGLDFVGTPEEWNKAAGFIYSYWGSGATVAPFGKDYDFAELVMEQQTSSYDEGWEYTIYDANGQQRNLDVKVTATLNDEIWGDTYEDYLKAKEAKRLKDEKKKERAAARKAKKEEAKKKALAKLTEEERKALGIK